MTSPLVHAIIAHMDSVFYGPNGDYPSVLEALNGISAGQALWKPSPTQNSIWQIVEHLIASKEWQMEMIRDGHPESPKWIEPSGDEAAWQATLQRLKDAHERLKVAVQDIPDTDLLTLPIPGDAHTLLELLLSPGPAHEAHHGGQIDYLKGLRKSAGASEGSTI